MITRRGSGPDRTSAPACAVGSAAERVVTGSIFLHRAVRPAAGRGSPPSACRTHRGDRRRDGHTGLMATRNTLSTRWVTVIMVVALVCSVAVVWG